MFKLLKRHITTSPTALAKINSSKQGKQFIIKSIIQDLPPRNTAIEAHYLFKQLENDPTTVVLSDEYKQLPEDSQFIEKHYDELIQYKEKFNKHKYSDFGVASNLFLQLSELKPIGRSKSGSVANSEEEEVGNDADTEVLKFDKFIRDLKITLRLNGGHLFILDLLIHNKEMFDNFEKNLKNLKKV